MAKQNFKLSREVEINGEKVKNIEYDLDFLTGESVETSMKELAVASYVPSVQEVDPVLHTHLFAQAANLDYLDIKRLPFVDYIKAGNVIRNFFMRDVEDSLQANSLEK